MSLKQLTVTAEAIDAIVGNTTGTGNTVLSVSPTLTGTPVAPTATAGTNTTQLATTQFVVNEIAAETPSTVTVATIFTSPTFTGTPIVPTAALGTNTTQIANTRFLAENTKLQIDLAYLGMSFVALPVGISMAYVSTEALTSQRLRGSTFILYDTTTVTGVKFVLTTAGSYTANNINGVCLYSVSSGTWNKVTGGEIDNANIWTVANLNTFAFTSPLSLPAGEYKLAFMYSSSAQTTAPVLGTFCPVVNFTSKILANSDELQQRLDTQTSFPTSEGATFFSAVGTIPMIWLY